MASIVTLQNRAGYGQSPEPQTFVFNDDGCIPNNGLPVLIYRASDPAISDLASVFEALFASNDWPPQWRGGVYDFHHYHSVSHETLGVARGNAQLLLGGDSGQTVAVGPGDVAILPAGTGHCRVQANNNFTVVAAYPPDQQDWDLCRADPAEHDAALARIKRVRTPERDPVSGHGSGLCELWWT